MHASHRRRSTAVLVRLRAAAVALVAVLALWAWPAAAAREAPANPAFSSAAEERAFGRAGELRRAGRLDEARTLALQGLTEADRNGSLSFAAWATEIALILEDQGHYREAEISHKRALEILERRIGRESPAVNVALQLLGLFYQKLGRFAEAEAQFARALSICRKLFGDDHQKTANVMTLLADVEREQNRFAESEAHLKRALAILEKTDGPQRALLVKGLTLFAWLHRDQGRPGQAEALLRRALAIGESVYGPQGVETASNLANLAATLETRGRLDEAEALYKRALAIREQALGPEHPHTARALNALASLYADQDRMTEAEQLCTRALAIRETALGPEHRETAESLDRLGFIYREQSRYDDAEVLYRRALSITEKALGAEHRDTAAALANLAALYGLTNRQAKAEPLLRRALAIAEKHDGADHPGTAVVLTNLAVVLAKTGRDSQGEPLLKRALAIFEKAYGGEHPSTATAGELLAQAYASRGRDAEAEPLFRRALAARRKTLPAGHRLIAHSLHSLSQTLFALGRLEESYALAKEAVDIFASSRAQEFRAELKGGPVLRPAYANAFVHKVRAGFALARAQPRREAELRTEAFDAAQRTDVDQTGRAVDRMAARFAAGSGDLARLLRDQRDLLRRLRVLDRTLVGALGSSDVDALAYAQTIRQDIAMIAARLSEIDATLRRSHGAYADLADPRPVAVAQTQALLKDGEAIVLFLVGAEDCFLFALSKSHVQWVKAPIKADELAKQVMALRRQLDPDQWRNRPLEPFDRARAHRLYRELWAPLEEILKGKTQVFVVPGGPLTSFPLSVLVTQEPKGGVAGDADPQSLRDTAWLIKRHALTTLPSIASLRALRVYAGKGSGSEPFAGFGDPALGPIETTTAGARSVASVFRGSSPDPEALRALSRLPRTAGELKALAKALGASETADVFLRERATEARIKSVDLSRKRVIAFATHGLMAGDMGLGEPGLVFTPPGAASERDDGYLSASEAAGLDLKADWIILSACNTAAGDTPGAEGLSGLARAFFLAGSRSLLVSHWPVWDDAAMKLTTGAVANMQKAPADGRAEALRQATLSVMNDASAARFAHPAAWAPFVLVGETRAN